MKKSGIISLLIILSFIAVFLTLPYIEYYDPEHKFRHDNRLIHQLKHSNVSSKIVVLTLFYPLLLIIESSLWTEKRKLRKRIIFISQAILILIGGFFLWFIMSFNIFSGRWSYQLPFYLVLTYLFLGILWDFLLGIPYFDNSNIITGSFKKLSIIERNKST